MGASSVRLRTRNEPTALAEAPNVMKTIENPVTNASADVSRLPRGALPSLSCSTPMPESIDTYPGTSGRTHGERNDTRPATNAANMETSIRIYRMPEFTPGSPHYQIFAYPLDAFRLFLARCILTTGPRRPWFLPTR